MIRTKYNASYFSVCKITITKLKMGLINQILVLFLACFKTNFSNMWTNRFLAIWASIFFMGLSIESGAQAKDTLWYLNGDFELISEYKFLENNEIINYKNAKGKFRDVESDFIYAIHMSNGEKVAVYQPSLNEQSTDTLSVEEMKSFVSGGHYANMEYRAIGAFLEGYIVGVAAPMAVATIGLNPFYALIVPAANSAVIGITRPSERKIIERHPDESKQALFIEGYREAAKRKRIKSSINGGLLGVVASITVIFVVSAN